MSARRRFSTRALSPSRRPRTRSRSLNCLYLTACGYSSWLSCLLRYCPAFVTNRREMWKIAQTAEQTFSRPSKLLNIQDKLAAYQLDAAVTTFYITIKNALQERIDVNFGDKKKSIAKYTLPQLLDERFQFGD